jgi:hypothetical protein
MRAAPGLLFGVAFAFACSACSGCDGAEAAKVTSSTSHVRPLTSQHGPTISGFRQRLEEEAKTRPQVPLKAEQVFASLEKEGVVLDRKRQQMASPHLARYCMSAHTGQKVQITVCEHESDERAEEHVKATQRLERPERRIAKNGTTTTLTRRDLNNDVEAPMVDKILRTFEAMKSAPADE